MNLASSGRKFNVKSTNEILYCVETNKQQESKWPIALITVVLKGRSAKQAVSIMKGLWNSYIRSTTDDFPPTYTIMEYVSITNVRHRHFDELRSSSYI